MRLIDANALEEILDEEFRNYSSFAKLLLISFAKRLLSDAPTIEAKPVKHGHWVKQMNGFDECSECKYHGSMVFRYCPNCGAKMEGDKR